MNTRTGNGSGPVHSTDNLYQLVTWVTIIEVQHGTCPENKLKKKENAKLLWFFKSLVGPNSVHPSLRWASWSLEASPSLHRMHPTRAKATITRSRRDPLAPTYVFGQLGATMPFENLMTLGQWLLVTLRAAAILNCRIPQESWSLWKTFSWRFIPRFPRSPPISLRVAVSGGQIW